MPSSSARTSTSITSGVRATPARLPPAWWVRRRCGTGSARASRPSSAELSAMRRHAGPAPYRQSRWGSRAAERALRPPSSENGWKAPGRERQADGGFLQALCKNPRWWQRVAALDLPDRRRQDWRRAVGSRRSHHSATSWSNAGISASCRCSTVSASGPRTRTKSPASAAPMASRSSASSARDASGTGRSAAKSVSQRGPPCAARPNRSQYRYGTRRKARSGERVPVVQP